MSRKLKDYYKEGVRLEKSMEIILGLLDNEKEVVDKILRDWSVYNSIARNLESLGFINYTHPPAAPQVTRRGGTLILSKRPYINPRLKHRSIPTEMGRFVMLKAIRDADWECFKEFYVARFFRVPNDLTTKIAIRKYIRRNYYPQFTEINMEHWYGLHFSVVEQLNADKVLEGRSFKEGFFDMMDPYSEGFDPIRFFGRSLKLPTMDTLTIIIEEALLIYRNELLGESLVGHCETLKTLIQILLLDADMFEDELRLSEKVIKILKDDGISLMRSNFPTLTDGRGMIDSRGNEQTNFKLFSFD